MKTPKTVGIIGLGNEGKWWHKHLETNNLNVIFSSEKKDNENIIRESDALLIAVPISEAHSVALQIKELAKKSTLVVSVCGKMLSVSNVFNDTKFETLLLHRMCGPHVPTMENQNLIVCNKTVKWRKFSESLVFSTGAKVFNSSPEEHDRSVDITQGLLRVIAIALGKMVLEKHKPFATVPFQGVMAIIARILDFGPDLSAEMVLSDQRFEETGENFIHQFREILDMDRKVWTEVFEELRSRFGEEMVNEGSDALKSFRVWW